MTPQRRCLGCHSSSLSLFIIVICCLLLFIVIVVCHCIVSLPHHQAVEVMVVVGRRLHH